MASILILYLLSLRRVADRREEGGLAYLPSENTISVSADVTSPAARHVVLLEDLA